MSTLKDLKKRLAGVLTTKQLAAAMKTVSSIKFSRINSLLSGYAEYSENLAQLAALVGVESRNPEGENGKRLYVLISGNRGLCGGYNIELFQFFDDLVKNGGDDRLYIACGKKAAEHCRLKNIPVLDTVSLPDIPQFDTAKALCERLLGLYESGKVSEINFVTQEYINLLKRQPKAKRFLPANGSNAENTEDILFVPDIKTAAERIYPAFLNTFVYSLLLNSAAGVQAATLTAMRSAYDTANESAIALSTAINRRRQADVTASVIETSSELNANKSEV